MLITESTDARGHSHGRLLAEALAPAGITAEVVADTVAPTRVGFGSDEVKPFGPLHAYVAPATIGVANAIVEPAQYGPPFAGTGAAILLTATFVVPAGEVQPATVTVTE